MIQNTIDSELFDNGCFSLIEAIVCQAAKDYLRAAMRRKQDRIGTLKRMATRFGPELKDVRVQESPDPTRMQDFLADAADEEKEIARLEEKRQEALCDSARLPSEEMALILERRYLDKWPWEEIIEETEMNRTRVFELHRTALDILTPVPEVEE